MKHTKQVFYDKKVDALWVRMKAGAEVDSREIAPGMTVEYDAKGNVIGVEIVRASRLFSKTSDKFQKQSLVNQLLTF